MLYAYVIWTVRYQISYPLWTRVTCVATSESKGVEMEASACEGVREGTGCVTNADSVWHGECQLPE